MVGKLGKKQQRYKRAECFFFFYAALKEGRFESERVGPLKIGIKKVLKIFTKRMCSKSGDRAIGRNREN